MSIEIHGREGCPYAWRARLVAAEKGIPYTFVAYDREPPDEGAERNPDHKSPLLIDDDFVIPESVVISAYLDEAYPGTSLTPVKPRDRAWMRLLMGQLEGLAADTRPGAVLSPEGRARVDAALAVLERELGADRQFVGGNRPSLADVVIWPMLAGLFLRLKLPIPEGPIQAYWDRVTARESFLETRPSWVAEG